jgi:hypothetical protein
LGEDAEIEFFPKKCGEGFPTPQFSIRNLRKENKLILDDFGNPYYSIEACIEQYADVVTKKGKDEYLLGTFPVTC